MGVTPVRMVCDKRQGWGGTDRPYPPPDGAGMASMSECDDLVWEGKGHRLVLSPRLGGRIISWRCAGVERVYEPAALEGGFMRVMFAEENYPGSSYCTAHPVLSCETDENGFRLHLQHYWYTPNVFAELFGWPEKHTQQYFSGILLDKVVHFDAALSVCTVDLTLTNLNDDARTIRPWVQNTFCTWTDHGFVVRDGKQEAYAPEGVYWAAHPPTGARSMRLIQADPAERFFAVLGAEPGRLTGMLKYDPTDFGEQGSEAIGELRYEPVRLDARQSWRANFFLALTDDWRRWAAAAPRPLYNELRAAAPEWQPSGLLPTLGAWAVPTERESGLMLVSFLDKMPFTSGQRYAPAHAVAGFHTSADGARAEVQVYALRELRGVSFCLDGPEGWTLAADNGPRQRELELDLVRHQLVRLSIEAPATLAGKERVRVRVGTAQGETAVLRVPSDAQIEPRYGFQFRQMAAHIEERFRAEKSGFTGKTRKEFFLWQAQLRRKYREWARRSVSGECDLAPRLLERQTGPTCVRDKIALQTEPGMWLPAYVIYPRTAPATMPAVLLIHGSGPGKSGFAPDEPPEGTVVPEGALVFDQPYEVARRLNCLVYVPDQRSQGEWGEWYSAEAVRRAGYNPWAMRMWDHLRSLDYLCSRPDVDVTRIGCMGASGGGSATMYTAGIDERVKAAILSSMPPYRVPLPHGLFCDPSCEAVLEDGWADLMTTPTPTADVCALNVPRALWIMDGMRDECWASPRDPNAEELYAKARAVAQDARDEIARLYALAGAADRLKVSWFDGGHCAGMTVGHAVEWFREQLL